VLSQCLGAARSGHRGRGARIWGDSQAGGQDLAVPGQIKKLMTIQLSN